MDIDFFNGRYIKINMECNKNITSKKKKILSDRKKSLKTKKIDYRTIKKETENNKDKIKEENLF